MPNMYEKLKAAQGMTPPQEQDKPRDMLSKLQAHAGLIPGQATQGVQNAAIQPLRPEQTQRLAEIRQQKQEQQSYERQRALETYGMPPPEGGQPSREEILLQQGVETEGAPLRLARMKAGFTSNPVPVIKQGLAEQFPDADPNSFMVRYIPRAPMEEIEKEMEDVIATGNRMAINEINERKQNGELIDDALKQKIFDRNLQTELTKMPSLELVYNNPETGRVTSANPTGADIGDFAELLGPALPFVGETLGAGLGAIGGAASPVPGGTVLGAGAGGAAGGGIGEGARLGIGRMIGVEPEEADWIDPVLSQSKESGVTSFLGGALNNVLTRVLAKGVAKGQFGLETARLARFIDPDQFAKNKQAVKRMNEIAKERGISLGARASIGQLSEDKRLLAMEKQLQQAGSPLDEISVEQARFLDAANTAFTPEGGLKRESVSDLVETIQNKIKDDIARREDLLGRELELSEAQEMALQVENILKKNVATKNALGQEGLRDAAEKAKQLILREDYGTRFNEIERRAAEIEGIPETFAQEARDNLAMGAEEVSPTFSEADKAFIRDAAIADTEEAASLKFPKKFAFVDADGNLQSENITPANVKKFRGFMRTSQNLKRLKRRADSGTLQDRDSKLYDGFIDAIEKDMEKIATEAGRKDIYNDLVKLREGYGSKKMMYSEAFGKLMKKDPVGNWTVTEPEFFEKILLGNDGNNAIAAKSLLEEANLLDNQIPLIQQGIKDVYKRKFLATGEPEPLTPARVRTSEIWFEENKESLKQFFSDKEIAQFKSPTVFAKKEQANRKKLEKANQKLREWFGTDLANTDPANFMAKLQSKMTVSRARKLKNILPEENWKELQGLYSQEVLANVRSLASEPGFSVKKAFEELALGPAPTSKELIGREVMEEFMGKKFVKDFADYADGMRVLHKTASNVEKVAQMPEEAKQLLRFFTQPLSQAGRRTRAILSLGMLNVDRRMQRAMANPESWEKMMKAVKKFDQRGLNEASATAATRLIYEALGNDLYPQLKQTNAAIEEQE